MHSTDPTPPDPAPPDPTPPDPTPPDPTPLVRVGETRDGLFTYLVNEPPEAMPPVRGRDIALAWDAARQAALDVRRGAVRSFRFRRRDGGFTDLALADLDALCWAGAVDRTLGMSNSYGLSVCLRLLALIDLLGRAGWASSVLKLERDGAELHPSLLRAAASAPLTEEARFDEVGFRSRLPHFMLDPPPRPARLTGAA